MENQGPFLSSEDGTGAQVQETVPEFRITLGRITTQLPARSSITSVRTMFVHDRGFGMVCSFY